MRFTTFLLTLYTVFSISREGAGSGDLDLVAQRALMAKVRAKDLAKRTVTKSVGGRATFYLRNEKLGPLTHFLFYNGLKDVLACKKTERLARWSLGGPRDVTVYASPTERCSMWGCDVWNVEHQFCQSPPFLENGEKNPSAEKMKLGTRFAEKFGSNYDFFPDSEFTKLSANALRCDQWPDEKLDVYKLRRGGATEHQSYGISLHPSGKNDGNPTLVFELLEVDAETLDQDFKPKVDLENELTFAIMITIKPKQAKQLNKEDKYGQLSYRDLCMAATQAGLEWQNNGEYQIRSHNCQHFVQTFKAALRMVNSKNKNTLAQMVKEIMQKDQVVEALKFAKETKVEKEKRLMETFSPALKRKKKQAENHVAYERAKRLIRELDEKKRVGNQARNKNEGGGGDVVRGVVEEAFRPGFGS